jgi:hypothetical protein
MKPKELPPYEACITVNYDQYTISERFEAATADELKRAIATMLAALEQLETVDAGLFPDEAGA